MSAEYSAEKLGSYLPSLRAMIRDSEKTLMANIFTGNCNYIFSSLLNSLEMVFDLPKYPFKELKTLDYSWVFGAVEI